MLDRFYVYVADHPATGIPIYVGKGCGNRIGDHNRDALKGRHRNKHLENIIKKHGPIEFTVVRDGLTEAEAFATEAALISQFGRANNGTGSLCNKTDGGEGPSGLVFSDEWRAAQSLRLKKVVKTPEWKAKIGAAHKGRTLSPEFRAKLSAARTGLKVSAEGRAKISASRKGKSLSASHRLAVSEGLKGLAKSAEHKAKLSVIRKSNPSKRCVVCGRFGKHIECEESRANAASALRN